MELTIERAPNQMDIHSSAIQMVISQNQAQCIYNHYHFITLEHPSKGPLATPEVKPIDIDLENKVHGETENEIEWDHAPSKSEPDPELIWISPIENTRKFAMIVGPAKVAAVIQLLVNEL